MSDTPATQVDTTNVVGNTGNAPTGTAYKSANTDTENAGPGAGGVTVPAPSPATQPDTSGTNSANVSFTPVSTSVSATIDTHSSDGAVLRQADPVYRAPGAPAAGSNRNTDLTDALGYGPAPTETQSSYSGTIETGAIGGGTLARPTTQTITIDQTTGVTLTKAGVIPTATVTITDNGQIFAVTAEGSHTIDATTPFSLTHAGVTTAAASLVVKKGATTLTYGVDYTATPTGSGATANFTIVRLATAATSNGDAVTVGYSYGNTAHFTPALLVVNTDYLLTYASEGANTTLTVKRKSTSSTAANGDSCVVNYSYGDATYYGSNLPTAVPDAPTLGHISTITDTVTIDHTTPLSLTKTGITTAAASLIVKKGATTLVLTTDYAVTTVGSGATKTYTILRNNSSTACADSDSVTVTYNYGTPAYFTPGPVVAINKGVTVKWIPPTTQIDIVGYVIQCSPGLGTEYAGANATKKDFTQVVPATPYQFRVAAWNSRGQGAWSDWSDVVRPLNTDAVPTGVLDPANTVNYIYNPDGTTKAGTGLGPS
jgi:hypothetical protein